MNIPTVFVTGAFLFCFSTGSANATSRGQYNPNGKFSAASNEWKPEWSEAFFKCIENSKEAKPDKGAKTDSIQAMFDDLSQGRIKDVGSGGKWCSNSDVYRPENAKLFQLAIFKILAKHESGYRADATNLNSPNPPALGLFQIGPTDVQAHKCTTPDGKPMYSDKQFLPAEINTTAKDMLKVPENNICCALQIAANNNQKNGNKGKFAEGTKGVMAAFWEPFRNKTGEIKGELDQKFCKSIGSPTELITTAEIEKARDIPTTQVAGDAPTRIGAAR